MKGKWKAKQPITLSDDKRREILANRDGPLKDFGRESCLPQTDRFTLQELLLHIVMTVAVQYPWFLLHNLGENLKPLYGSEEGLEELKRNGLPAVDTVPSAWITEDGNCKAKEQQEIWQEIKAFCAELAPERNAGNIHNKYKRLVVEKKAKWDVDKGHDQYYQGLYSFLVNFRKYQRSFVDTCVEKQRSVEQAQAWGPEQVDPLIFVPLVPGYPAQQVPPNLTFPAEETDFDDFVDVGRWTQQHQRNQKVKQKQYIRLQQPHRQENPQVDGDDGNINDDDDDDNEIIARQIVTIQDAVRDSVFATHGIESESERSRRVKSWILAIRRRGQQAGYAFCIFVMIMVGSPFWSERLWHDAGSEWSPTLYVCQEDEKECSPTNWLPLLPFIAEIFSISSFRADFYVCMSLIFYVQINWSPGVFKIVALITTLVISFIKFVPSPVRNGPFECVLAAVLCSMSLVLSSYHMYKFFVASHEEDFDFKEWLFGSDPFCTRKCATPVVMVASSTGQFWGHVPFSFALHLCVLVNFVSGCDQYEILHRKSHGEHNMWFSQIGFSFILISLLVIGYGSYTLVFQVVTYFNVVTFGNVDMSSKGASENMKICGAEAFAGILNTLGILFVFFWYGCYKKDLSLVNVN